MEPQELQTNRSTVVTASVRLNVSTGRIGFVLGDITEIACQKHITTVLRSISQRGRSD
jgi:hypothetical protein